MAKRNLAEYLRNWRLGLTRKIMVDDVPPLPVYIMGVNDGADALTTTLPIDGTVVEASAAAALVLLGTIDADTGATVTALGNQGIIKNLMVSQSGSMYGGIDTETDSWRFEHLTKVMPIVTDGAGDSAVVELMPIVGGYVPHMKLLYVYADGTDPAWDLALTVSGGALLGMPNFTGLATVVNVVGPNWSPGLVYAGNTVATSISAQIANGGNVITYYFVCEIWYELT